MYVACKFFFIVVLVNFLGCYNNSVALKFCVIIIFKMCCIVCQIGCGTLFNQKLVSSSELQQMVKDNMLVNLKGAYYTNTSKLGEVLLETMLQEVSEFCKIHVQQNWAPQAHQQVPFKSIIILCEFFCVHS